MFPMRIPACQSALFPLSFPFADWQGSVWISPLIPFAGQLLFPLSFPFADRQGSIWFPPSIPFAGQLRFRCLSLLPIGRVLFEYRCVIPFAGRGGSGSASILASRSRGNRIRCQRILLRLSLRQPLPDRPHSPVQKKDLLPPRVSSARGKTIAICP